MLRTVTGANHALSQPLAHRLHKRRAQEAGIDLLGAQPQLLGLFQKGKHLGRPQGQEDNVRGSRLQAWQHPRKIGGAKGDLLLEDHLHASLFGKVRRPAANVPGMRRVRADNGHCLVARGSLLVGIGNHLEVGPGPRAAQLQHTGKPLQATREQGGIIGLARHHRHTQALGHRRSRLGDRAGEGADKGVYLVDIGQLLIEFHGLLGLALIVIHDEVERHLFAQFLNQHAPFVVHHLRPGLHKLEHPGARLGGEGPGHRQAGADLHRLRRRRR